MKVRAQGASVGWPCLESGGGHGGGGSAATGLIYLCSLISAEHAPELVVPSSTAASSTAAARGPLQQQQQEGKGAGQQAEQARRQPEPLQVALEQTLKLALESLQAERQARQAAEQQQQALELSLQEERQGRQAAEQEHKVALQHQLQLERQKWQAAEQALQQAAEAATARNVLSRQVVLHGAALRGDLQEVRLILATAPQTAAVTDVCGAKPFHLAATAGSAGVETLQLLLDAAPAALTATNSAGATALHYAAQTYGGEAAVRWLLQRAPQLASVRDRQGAFPLHAAASQLRVGNMRLLLAAAPLTALARDTHGRTPLHAAAASQFYFSDGDGAAIQLLFDAEPTTARALDRSGHTPLELLLCNPKSTAAARQLGIHSLSSTLALLRAARQPNTQDLPARLSAALPLTTLEWASLPQAILPTVLPIALAHSPAQARQLVLQLPSLDRRRLRTMALCLARVQRSTGLPLPQAILQSILVQACCLLSAS